jgi:hypothetical protein
MSKVLVKILLETFLSNCQARFVFDVLFAVDNRLHRITPNADNIVTTAGVLVNLGGNSFTDTT